MLSLLLANLVIVHTVSSHGNTDEVKHLPGLNGTIQFKHYSGYLKASNDKYLHYWFVESQNSPLKDPLLLWLNGGPGCSSLEGLLSELGPFLVNQDGKTLHINEYSWNKVANILFLEAPVGVGFSYSKSGIYDTDDDITADDSYLALHHFFEKFPRFQKNDFYISGESYAGVYIPTLSVLILEGPAKINLKGFVIGNGYLDVAKLSNSIVFFVYYHGLIDGTLWSDLIKWCCEGNISRYTCIFDQSLVPQCADYVKDVNDVLYNSDLDIYNLYSNCANSSTSKLSRQSFDRRNLLEGFPFMTYGEEFKLCIDNDALTSYLQQETVRKAIHIPPSVGNWSICSDVLEESYQKLYLSMKPQITKLLDSSKLRGLIYNGDVDMACNFLGNEWFVEDLGLDLVESYRAWKFDDQVAGFVKIYKNLTYLTVKGSGHMVPQDKPGPALKMITSFLSNKPY